ncbi:MAG TPA: PKD domain-containing protein [Bacteroidia bacterium]|nr:PKD domain-containing protein [Bacteroidia bacterium]
MKHFIKQVIVAVCIFIPVFGIAQTDQHHEHQGLNGEHIDKFYIPYEFSADSLVGFDENAAWQQAQLQTNELWQQKRIVALLKRNYIDFQYGLKSVVPSNPTVQAPCTNPGFETGTLTGWTAVESSNNNSQTMLPWTSAATTQAVIVGPGNDPNVGALIPQVPPGGGNFACRLGQTGTGGMSYRLNQTFTVTAANSVFIYKYAVVLQDGGHACSDQPFFNIRFETCNGTVIPCAQYQVAQMGSACSSGDPNFLTSGSWSYLPWQTRSFDLTAYIGQCVNIEFTVGGCVASQGAHPGYCYIDAACDPMTLELNGTDIPVGQTTTNMCSTTTNTLCAPPGFVSYSWTGPGATGNTNRCITTSTSGTYSVTLGMQGTSCQNPVLYSTFNIVPKPIANFTFSTNPCSNGLSVPFVDGTTLNGGPAISNWYWDFDNDGVTDNTTQSPTNTYTAPGTYSAQLLVSNGGCTDSITKVLTVSQSVVANFNNTSGCLNGSTSFSSTSTPTAGLASHVWDFGDGTANGSGANPVHTYTTPGIKNVTYTVTNSSGCQSVITKTLNVFPNPVAAISANTVCLGLPTTFNNTSNVTAPATINTWAWDFDNNGTPDNTTQSPTNTYTAAGNYSVELVVATADGCKDSLTIPVVVNALPTATFTPSNACVNANVALNNTSSPAANMSTYSWNFGAGASPATGSTANPNLVYTTPGVKTIVLNITANTTCTATITKTVEVFPSPVANFSATSVCQGTTTAYTDLSTPTGSIGSWQWDFTSNNSIDNTTTSPSNTFPTSGTFTTSLIVTDNHTCKDTVKLPIDVWGHSIPNFNPTTVCFGATSSFSNTTDVTTNANVGGTPTWAWGFGDGGTSSLQDPTYTYTSSVTPSYNVTLTATTVNGCVDNLVKTVSVNALPTATFTPVNACVNTNVLLNNSSSIALPDNITNYSWTFGTGASPATSNVQNPPTLNYNSSGIKSITLIITANTTCSASITQTVEVYAQPVANFSATSVCQSTATAYTDLSTPTGSITGWAWDFTNNGTVDNTTNSPTNIFPTSGTFTTSLIVTDNHTCKDTVKLPIDVWGHTIPNFTPDKVCFGTSSLFTNLTDETTNPNVGVGTTYTWDFADTSPTSNIFSPTHIYTLGGNGNATYNVTLTATSLHNCIDNAVKTVSVYAIPTASFTSNQVCFGSATTLTDASLGNGNFVNTFTWDFSNDGTVDVTGVANPNYTFPNFGVNAVSYTVSTNPATGLVCSNATNTITVFVNPNPIPDFTFVNNCVNAQPNTFNASSSTIAIGTNTTYAWAFGNSITVSGAASTSSVSYAAPGVYNVTLTVTSDKGCVKNVVKQVEVYAKPIMNIANSPACDGAAMTFSAQPLAGSGTVTNWYWDFNNSLFSIEATGQNTGFTFTGPGTQTVGLITETGNGCKDTIIKSIYVNYVPVPQFSVDKPSGCPEWCVKFTDATPAITAPAQIVQWQWDLGDGSTVTNSSGSDVKHCYNNSSSNQLALFNVGLTVTTDSGCVATLTKPNFITVYPRPIANYTVSPNPTSIIEPLVYFTNQSQDYIKWWWTFVGTGPFKVDSVNLNPSHLYDSETAETYSTNLIVMNQYGCTDTAYVPVEITPEFTFYIPNAFSPSNNDGINDYFNGTGIGIATYEMWVFDRWGEKIFYTDDIKKGWDGRVQGKGAEGKQDVYVWKVRLKDVLGKKHEYIGHVTLLR